MTNYLKCLILLLFVGNLAIAGEKKVRCVIRGELIGMEAKEVRIIIRLYVLIKVGNMIAQ